MLKMFFTGLRVFWVRDVESNDFEKEMLDAYNSFNEKEKSSIDFIFIVKLHFEVSDKVLSEIVSAPFNRGEDHGGVWTDVVMISANWIGFNPDEHVFVCHKCQGILAGNANHKGCGCISGWVRPYQRYINKESLKTEL